MSVSSRVVIVGNVESKSGLAPAKDGKPAKPWTRYSLKDQGDKFVGSTFSDTIAGILKSNIGQQVTVEVEERENPDPMKQPFRDIVGAIPGVVASAADARSVAPNATGGAAQTNTNQNVRIAALQAAARVAPDSNETLRIADKFVSWLTETEQVTHIKAFDPDSFAERERRESIAAEHIPF